MFSFIRAASIHKSRELLNGNFSKLRIINTNSVSSNNYSPRRRLQIFSSHAKEISIPVPYGQLAAKAWGFENGHPVLTIHGFMDNCGTFDRLIPLLDKSLFIIALDLPGHGFSSHKPPGCFYTLTDMLVAIQYVAKHFNWQKFNIIAHSMGGQIAQLFTGFYPELIENLVVLDIIKPFSVPAKDIPDIMVETFKRNFELAEKLSSAAPVYTRESACKRLVDGLHGEITEDLAQFILKRGTKLSECGNGLVFTRDLRLRNVIHNSIFSNELIHEIMNRIQNKMLLIRANNTHAAYISRSLDYDLKFLDLFRKNCESFSLETVPGNHYIHLNGPEIIAPLINKFMQKY